MIKREEIEAWLSKNYYALDCPGAYLGDEPNVIVNENAKSRALMVGLSGYVQLAGNLAVPLLTQMLNETSKVQAHRAYFPSSRPDLERLQDAGMPLVFSIETKEPLEAYPVICFSASYSGLDFNTIQILRSYGWPYRAKDRIDKPIPILMRGGQAISNIDPFVDLYDLVYVGEAETQLISILEEIGEKEGKVSKLDLIKQLLAKHDCLYSPIGVTEHYLENGRVSHWTAEEGFRTTVRRTFRENLDDYYTYSRQIGNYLDMMGQGNFLISIGCGSASCTFAVSEDTWVLGEKGLVRAKSWGSETKDLNETIASMGGMRSATRYIRRGRKWGYEIELRTGHRVVATEEHPLLGLKAAERMKTHPKVQWIDAEDLSVGDWVAVSNRDYSGEFELPGPRDFDLAWLLGYWSGDGGTRKDGSQSYLCCNGTAELEFVEAYLRRLYGPVLPKRNQHSVSKGVVSLWFTKHPFHRDVKEKGIPWVLQNPNLFKSFISGFVQADGWACRGNYVVTTAKKELAEVVQMMASSLGVISTRHEYKHPQPRRQSRHYVSFRGMNLTEILKPLKCEYVPENQHSYVTTLGERSGAFSLEGFVLSKVEKKTRVSERETVDLTVPEGENFWANGIVVHNCGEGQINRPYRQHSLDVIVEGVDVLMKTTGAREPLLSAFTSSNYTRKKQLISALVDKGYHEIAMISQRCDETAEDPEFVELMGLTGNHSVSLGVESHSERGRKALSKWATEEQIFGAVENFIKAGYSKIKMFFLGNVPGETLEDVMEIERLAKGFKALKEKYQYTGTFLVSWSPLVITGMTALQWYAPTFDERTLSGPIQILRENGIDFRIGSSSRGDTLWLEQLEHFGDRRLLPLFIEMVENSNFSYYGAVSRGRRDWIIDNCEKYGITTYLYMRQHDVEEVLPWDWIDIRVSKAKMVESYLLSLKSESVPKCQEKCWSCGACTKDTVAQLKEGRKQKAEDKVDMLSLRKKLMVSKVYPYRYLFSFYVEAPYIYLDNSVYSSFLLRALRLAGYDASSKMKLAVSSSDEKDYCIGLNYVEMEITAPLKEGALLEELQQHIKQFSLLGVKPLVTPDMQGIYNRGRVLYAADLPMSEVSYAQRVERKKAEDSVYLVKDGWTYFSLPVSVTPYQHIMDTSGLKGKKLYSIPIKRLGVYPTLEAKRSLFSKVCIGCGTPKPVDLMGTPAPLCLVCGLDK